MFLDSVRLFFKRLIEDKDFRSQVENAASPEEYRQMIREAGYDFTKKEFETAAVQILNSSLRDLSEEEQEVVFGGVSSYLWEWDGSTKPPIQQRYGVIRPCIKPCIKPPIQPRYGVIRPTEKY